MKDINKVLLLTLIGFLCLARFAYLSVVPGINGDEALYGIKTAIMMHNPFTLTGFNSYTGPLISYLRIPFYYLMGINVFSLRFPVVILNLIAIFYVYKLLKRLYGRITGITGALLLLVMPWSFIDSRFADETHTALVFFAAGGLYYLTAGKNLSNRILAALFLGLGVFNHMIFIVTAVSYFIYFLIKNKFKLKLGKADALFIVVFSGFLFLRIALVLKAHFFNPGGSGIYYNARDVLNRDFIPDFVSLAPHFLNMLDGSVFYERMTGAISFFVIPLNSFLFILSFLFIAFRPKFNPEFKDKDRMFAGIFILNYLINSIFLRQFALRYFLITLMFATVLMAIFIGTGNMRNAVRIFCLSCLVIINCFYVGYNYIYTFKKTGGRVSYFQSGNFTENSNGFVDSAPLYGYLKKRGIKYIWVPEGYPRWQLIFWDLREKRLSIESTLHYFSKDEVYFISYKGDKPPYEYGVPKGHSIQEENAPGLGNYRIFLVKRTRGGAE